MAAVSVSVSVSVSVFLFLFVAVAVAVAVAFRSAVSGSRSSPSPTSSTSMPAATAAVCATGRRAPPLTSALAPLCRSTYATSSATISACTGTTVAPAARTA